MRISFRERPTDGRVRNEPLTVTKKAHVRYLGFEAIEGGRRLRFYVKPAGEPSREITFDISDAAFSRTSGITLQDAAPMAFEKLTALLEKQNILDPDEFCLTDQDVAEYTQRHTGSHKRVDAA
jgi:hypothetical protein